MKLSAAISFGMVLFLTLISFYHIAHQNKIEFIFCVTFASLNLIFGLLQKDS